MSFERGAVLLILKATSFPSEQGICIKFISVGRERRMGGRREKGGRSEERREGKEMRKKEWRHGRQRGRQEGTSAFNFQIDVFNWLCLGLNYLIQRLKIEGEKRERGKRESKRERERERERQWNREREGERVK
jgi:hypothetical protein